MAKLPLRRVFRRFAIHLDLYARLRID
jgi:hypothetical protein